MTYQDRIALWQDVPLARWPSDLATEYFEQEAKQRRKAAVAQRPVVIAVRVLWMVACLVVVAATGSFWPLAVLAALGLLWIARPLP
ncbi:hypothetical protein [Mesorhizobium sp. L-8-3]|uniref:hypothetical protein n=1 Tax=Mesorhizobium sp. L-8-3 TaxID=2744522 RepID=UPI00192580B1|nr:hypothetical protein [Mesorhizobium sp. L-8-3]BCH25781.1 hypothetical protein MesoLjLb_55660 [Mesorhizobium sp. L-8-3]